MDHIDRNVRKFKYGNNYYKLSLVSNLVASVKVLNMYLQWQIIANSID